MIPTSSLIPATRKWSARSMPARIRSCPHQITADLHRCTCSRNCACCSLRVVECEVQAAAGRTISENIISSWRAPPAPRLLAPGAAPAPVHDAAGFEAIACFLPELRAEQILVIHEAKGRLLENRNLGIRLRIQHPLKNLQKWSRLQCWPMHRT